MSITCLVSKSDLPVRLTNHFLVSLRGYKCSHVFFFSTQWQGHKQQLQAHMLGDHSAEVHKLRHTVSLLTVQQKQTEYIHPEKINEV